MDTVTATPDRVSLYYREGSSDKVYQAAIEPADHQFVVNFAYGRRGATLTTGTKTSTPVDYATAQQIFTKLVGEKKAKGYTESANGTTYQHTDKRVSFKGTVDTLRQWRELFETGKAGVRAGCRLKELFYQSIAEDLLPERPGQSEPRMRKRRPKNFPLMMRPRPEIIAEATQTKSSKHALI